MTVGLEGTLCLFRVGHGGACLCRESATVYLSIYISFYISFLLAYTYTHPLCALRSFRCCFNVIGCRLTYEGQAETNA